MIIHLLWSGPKRPEELLDLLEGEVSRPTVFRSLKRLLANKTIDRRDERRNGELAVYYFLPEREERVSPPYVVAPQELIDECLAQMENTLEFGRLVALKYAKGEYQKLAEFVKSSEVMGDSEKKKLLKSFAIGKKELAKSSFDVLLANATVKFEQLCSEYVGVTRDRNLSRIIKILDRLENFEDDYSLFITIDAFLTLVDHAFQKKESAMVIASMKSKLDLLERLCLTKLKSGFLTLGLINRISQKKARETFLNMIGVGKYSFENLIDNTPRFYRENLNKLKTDLDRRSSKSDLKTKERFEKFWAMFQLTLLEARVVPNKPKFTSKK